VPVRAQAERLRALLAAAVASVGPSAANTTLAVVATDLALDPAQARRMATAAHAGLARSLAPVHTLLDGDTVFTLATGAVPLPGSAPERTGALLALHTAAADAVLLAVLDAVLAARPVRTRALDVPGYAQVCPSAVPMV
jgi:L-aminopeptidase/D-esterase-like protein